MASTRVQLTCPVYGIECELTSRKLLTVKEVMQHYSFVQLQLPRTTKSTIIVSQVSVNVIDIWLKSGISTFTMRRVQQKVESLHNNLRMVLKRKGQPRLQWYQLLSRKVQFRSTLQHVIVII